ncbi:MAG: hypothetical protein JW720_05190 [Sedimentisphaerales bacterium]|nr:hypothetical protein [Sedimentisphaerales bacterium]
MARRFFFKSSSLGTITFVLFMSLSTSAMPLQNGDFSAGLTGWDVDPFGGPVIDGGGFALLSEDDVVMLSSLTQEFSLPIDAKILSFDFVMSATGTPDPFGMWADAFAVSLLEPAPSFLPLISNPGYSEFYYLENTGYEETVAGVLGDTVSLDVSAFAGRDVLLAFDLIGADDGMETTVSVDNVEVSTVVIPAPGALLLGYIGTCGVCLWRRRSCAESR